MEFFFFLGLISDYLYLKTVDLSKKDLVEVLKLWPFYCLIPFFVCWVYKIKTACPNKGSILPGNVMWLALLSVVVAGIWVFESFFQILTGRSSYLRQWRKFSFRKNLAAEIIHVFIPNWQHFWMADALVAQKMIPFNYLFFAGVYFFVFLFLFVLITLFFFDFRDIGRANHAIRVCSLKRLLS